MSSDTNNTDADRNGKSPSRETAEWLRAEAERLRLLEVALNAKEAGLAEIMKMYPVFKKIAYKVIAEHFAKTVPELPHDDLERLAIEEDAQPIDNLLDELEAEVRLQ